VTETYRCAITEASIDERFRFRSAKSGQMDRIGALLEHHRLVARTIAKCCPPSYERDEALKSIDQASAWANQAIIRNE
jgi:hypothetical protein